MIFKKKGAVLVAMLLIALIITLFGISMTSSTVQNERIAYNFRDYDSAFSAANSALIEGEDTIRKTPSIPNKCTQLTAGCTFYVANIIPNMTAQTNSWWQTFGNLYSGNLTTITSSPRYLIEEKYFIADDLSTDSIATGYGNYYYKISARGTGKTDDAEVIVQSVFVTRYN